MTPGARGIAAFLVLAFGFAWVAWGLALASGVSPTADIGRFQLFLVPGAIAPAIAAATVRKWVTHEGFADAGLHLNLRRWPFYLVAGFLPLLAVVVIVGLAVATGLSEPDFTLVRVLKTLAPGRNLALPSWVLPVLPAELLLASVASSPLLFGEEFGWRGYLQLRLLAHRPLLAAIATGLIWGVWHYPLLLVGYQFPGHTVAGLAVFPVTTVLLSIIFGWLRLQSGSIWPACLAHAATNAVGMSLTMLLFLGGPNWLLVSYLGVLGWLPLGALSAWIVLTGRLAPAIGPPQ